MQIINYLNSFSFKKILILVNFYIIIFFSLIKFDWINSDFLNKSKVLESSDYLNKKCNKTNIAINSSIILEKIKIDFNLNNQWYEACKNADGKYENKIKILTTSQQNSQENYKIIVQNLVVSKEEIGFVECHGGSFTKETSMPENKDNLHFKIKFNFVLVDNEFVADVNENGFYQIKCFLLPKINKFNIPQKPKIIFNEIITIFPTNMSILNVQHKPYKELVYKIKQQINDTTENPFLNDGNLYEKCLNETLTQNVTTTNISTKKMNTLIIVFDSVSANHFKRIFPLTFNYIDRKMKSGLFFTNYMTTGINTITNITPFLTGLNMEYHKDIELINEKEVLFKDGYYDLYPFIWNDYESLNYITMYNEDSIHYGTYNNGEKGFKYFPTSYYTTQFWYKYYKLLNSYYCYNNQQFKKPSYMTSLEKIKEFVLNFNASLNQKEAYFSFNFINFYTHDNLVIPNGYDFMLKNMLEELEKKTLLDNTLLILKSDHGNRLSSLYQDTQEGKIEFTQPFLAIKLPKLLENTSFATNFFNNKHKLLSSFDLYKTLKEFYYMNKVGLKNFEKNHECRNLFEVSTQNKRALRGISLFEEIPQDRACEDALIPKKHCSCISKTNISELLFLNETKQNYAFASTILIDGLNDITSNHRSICSLFKMDKILSTYKSSTKTVNFYEFNFIVQPGNATFQAEFYYKNGELQLSSSIFRVSKYAEQSFCMKEKKYFMPYCFCYKENK